MSAHTVPRQRAHGGDAASSWELVRRAQAGDRDAFADIYRRYHELVLKFAYRRVADRPTAEDITSDVFLTMIRRIDGFTRPDRDFGAWLVTITRNKIIDRGKCGPAHYEIPYERGALFADVWEGGGSRVPGTAELALTRDRDRALWAAVAGLDSDRQRRVIALRFLRGLSIEDTARVMGANVGQVKALQYRATRALRRALSAEVTG